MANPPPDLAQYTNGQIPASALTSIGGGHKLAAAAAAAFLRMKAAAATAGVAIGITDSYRSYDAQVACVAGKGLYSDGGLCAKPGTSEHGWAQAVDVSVNPAGQAWLRANAGAYGFVEDTPREPWHWGYHGPGSGNEGTAAVSSNYPTTGQLTPAQLAALNARAAADAAAHPGENLTVPGGSWLDNAGEKLGGLPGAGAVTKPLLGAIGVAGGALDLLTSPLEFLKSIPDLLTRLTVFTVVAGAGAVIIVLGAWRAVAPARQAVQQRVTEAASVAAVA